MLHDEDFDAAEAVSDSSSESVVSEKKDKRGRPKSKKKEKKTIKTSSKPRKTTSENMSTKISIWKKVPAGDLKFRMFLLGIQCVGRDWGGV